MSRTATWLPTPHPQNTAHLLSLFRSTKEELDALASTLTPIAPPIHALAANLATLSSTAQSQVAHLATLRAHLATLSSLQSQEASLAVHLADIEHPSNAHVLSGHP